MITPNGFIYFYLITFITKVKFDNFSQLKLNNKIYFFEKVFEVR